jgi:hypothetical protein
VTSSQIVSSRFAYRSSLSSQLEEEGLDWVNGNLTPANNKFRLLEELKEGLAREIFEKKYDSEFTQKDLPAILTGLTPGARWMARQIAFFHQKPDLKELSRSWLSWVALHEWERNLEDLEWYQEKYKTKCLAVNLFYLKIQTGAHADRFLDLYEKVYDPSYSFASGSQIDQFRVRDVALTSNYNKLPVWVKKELISAYNTTIATKDNGARVGDIWRLIPCAKAWKWCPALPKKVAERIGGMPVRYRVLASLAWNSFSASDYWDISCFWGRLKEFSSKPALDLVPLLKNSTFNFYRGLEILLGVPYRSLDHIEKELGRAHKFTSDYLVDQLLDRVEPKDLCRSYFGTDKPSVLKAFIQAKGLNQLLWASNLGGNDPNIICKILSLPKVIPFEPEALPFLDSFTNVQSAIRLIQKTEYTYRGEEFEVIPNLVRDVGFIWSSIRDKSVLPQRLRCWFSIHEVFTAAYVEEMPDEPLPVNEKWVAVDGLSGINQDWELKLPTNTRDLKIWGRQLANCVGAYGKRIKEGSSIILAVLKGSLVVATIEVIPTGKDHYWLTQFSGYKNRPVCQLDTALQFAVLQSIGTLVDNDFRL